MKTGLQMLILTILLATGTVLAAPVTLESRPQQAILYRDGTAVVAEQLQAGPQTVIRLPAETDLSSVQVLLDGKRVQSLQLESLTEERTATEKAIVQGVVVEKLVTTQQLAGYLLRPGVTGTAASLSLRYATSGITWRPEIDVEILEGDRAEVTLTALVTSQALDLRECRLRLASGPGPLSSLIYDAGTQTVEKGKHTLITVRSESGRYARKLTWNTAGRERVQAVVTVPNPFPLPIGPAPARLSSKGVLVSRDSVEWVAPGEPLILAAGQVPDIEVERSVDTTEDLANKATPFHHAIRFKVLNRGEEPVNLEVVMPKKLGSRHKTLYHFKRAPDRRPGELFFWDLRLKGGQAEVISFSFDSEFPRFDDYQNYEKARAEMF